MKAPKHKWLCIYYAPNGQAYYRYGATKRDVQAWFRGKDGSAEYFKLTYTKSGEDRRVGNFNDARYSTKHPLFETVSGAW